MHIESCSIAVSVRNRIVYRQFAISLIGKECSLLEDREEAEPSDVF